MKEYDTICMVENFLDLDEFVKEVEMRIEESGLDRDKVKIVALDGEIFLEEEFEV